MGTLVESGTWNGLLSKNGKFKAFCEVQGVIN